MARASKKKSTSTSKSTSKDTACTENDHAFALADHKKPTPLQKERVHSLGKGKVCGTGSRGHATPRGRSPLDIVVDTSEGFVPLWAACTTLRWRFNEPSMEVFVSPEQAKEALRGQFAEAVLAWGDASPVRFTENEDLWDFEIIMSAGDNCDANGCTLARAFFPNSGRNDLMLFPKMFEQSRKEQIDTWIHEIGHVFGLRHFFATVNETAWPSEVFGTHNKFSIMNYGALSELTDADREDLTRLYEEAWSGALTHINGTPIQFMRPFHVFAPEPCDGTGSDPGATALRSSGSYYRAGAPRMPSS